jgi:hypothetical protein
MFFLFRGSAQSDAFLSLAVLYCGGEIDDWMPPCLRHVVGSVLSQGVLLAPSTFWWQYLPCAIHMSKWYESSALWGIFQQGHQIVCASYNPVYILEDKSSTLTIRRFYRGISWWGKGPRSAAHWEASNLLGVLLLPGELQKNIYLNCTK